MQRVAIYCRLSDEDRNKKNGEDSESIQNQKNMLTSYALKQGWEIYKIYSDDDWSGLDSQRPDWNKMIEEAEARKFDIVLCKNQYRFTRDIEIVEKFLHKWFPIWGIRFMGYTDNADTFNDSNKKQRQVNGLVGEWYCEDISNWVKASLDQKRRDGVYIGSLTCYGYRKNPDEKGKLLVDTEAAIVVKRIFEMYLEGYGCVRIAKELNAENIPNPTKYKNLNGANWKRQNDGGGLWSKTTIRRILTNQIYVGDMVQGKHKKVSFKEKKIAATPSEEWYIVKDMHEAIIDRESFKQVREMLLRKCRHDGSGEIHAVAGKVKCADCGSTMQRLTPRKRDGEPFPYSYLRCSMIEKKRETCTGHYMRLDRLEEIILERMRQYFKDINEKCIENNLKEISQKKDSNWNAIFLQIRKLEKQKNDNDNAVVSLYRDRTSGSLSIEHFNTLSDTFIRDNDLITERIYKLTQLIETSKAEKNETISISQRIKDYKNPVVLTPRLVNEFIEIITIGEKNKETGEQEIKIIWKY